ncbi:MAG: flagellar hook-associated protein FlgK [Candidatus Nitricoxidivorans perseverans]|uniref:Flagellar hook-associated protein 1 n=1 Tax=Candidatus Nitricoxidivorans perseverans TaxID=2975601 RepID=A0AA49J1Z8_9PROT|nr:MAG: flagellar hook-associated protein FlgK [Candidatus Nitricoxidivorans perseverans]
MSSGVFSVGLTALSAAQVGVLTTSHNIANASTQGYTRQQIVQTTNTPLFTGVGFLGQGTSVQTIQRVYNQFISNQLMAAQTGVAEMDTYLAQIDQLDNLLADPNAGLSPALSDFFNGVQELAANPSSVPARQAMLSGGQALAARFQSIDRRISEVRDGVNQQITDEIAKINSYATQLGEINQRIILAQATGSNQPPNDLIDQREQLISDLNKEIRTQTFQQGDGTYNIFIGNGQPLVVGREVSTLQAVQDVNDPQKITVSLRSPYGTTMTLIESLLTGGNLGGLLAFRSQSLDPAQNALGRVAIGLAQTFNEIHRLGQDLTGALGGNFFNVPAPVVNSGTLNATQATVLSAQIVNSDYRVVFDGTNYDVTRLSDGTAFNNLTFPAVVDGVTISLSSGTPLVNDAFIVRPGNPAGSRVIAESDNTGTAVLNSAGSNIQALTVSDYRLDVTAAGGPYTFTLTRLSDGQLWSGSGASAALALADLATQQQVGFNLAFSGTNPSVGDSFSIQPTRVGARNISVALTDPSAIAAAAPFRTAATLGNTGTATISAGSVEDKSYLPLTAPVTLTFNSTTNQFAVAGAVPAVANIAYNPATVTSKAISFNGLSFTISGTPQNGDTFTLSANANGVSDSRTMQLLGGLQTLNALAGTPGSTSAGATASFQAAYAQIVSQVGNKAREVEVTGKAQQSLADQAQSARDQISGVNLDEEAANLMRYQQAYQAAAKMLDIAGRLLDEILALGR